MLALTGRSSSSCALITELEMRITKLEFTILLENEPPEGWGWGGIVPTEGKIIKLEDWQLWRVPNSFAR
jgi:hypothetical protein